MDIDTFKKTEGVGTIPVYEPSNYSFIFKKTEKIVCAVFYITDIRDTKDNYKDSIVTDIQDSSRNALDSVLQLLTDVSAATTASASQSIRTLLRLRSALNVGQAAGVLQKEHTAILGREIDDVLRNINELLLQDDRKDTLDMNTEEEYRFAVRNKRLSQRQTETSRPRTAVRQHDTEQKAAQAHTDRREVIKSILRSKGQANIKDISAVVTDCSEKTLQRELISMIQSGEVVREGERRWSFYKLSQ